MALSSSQLSILFLIPFGFLVCLAGVAAPYWEYQDIQDPDGPDTHIAIGLYYACAESPPADYDDCVTLPWHLEGIEDSDVYFKVVRILMPASILFELIAVLTGLVTCCQKATAHNVMFESIMATLGGMAGIAGIATFAAHSPENYNPFSSEFPLVVDLDLYKSFAFYLSAVGSGFLLIIGVLGCCAPKRRLRYVDTTSGRNAERSGYSNPNYRNGEEQPLSHGSQTVRKY